MYYNVNLESFKQVLRLHADLLDTIAAALDRQEDQVDQCYKDLVAAERDLSVPEEDFQKLEEVYDQALESRDHIDQAYSLEQKFLHHAREALEAWEMLDSEFRPGI